MKKILFLLLAFALLFLYACTPDMWVEFDYSDPEDKFKAEQMILIEDEDEFEDFFECKVWATKRTLGLVLPGTKQEYFEGYICRVTGWNDMYIFMYNLKGNYADGDYNECTVIDFNDVERFKDEPLDDYRGHYRIDKIKIKSKGDM